MLNPFLCGSFSHHEQEEDELFLCSPPSTPTKKSRKSSRDSKNPYSSRGLDKFSALLSELDEKRRKIYTQMGAEEISFVRFVYSGSNDCVPVVVKVKDHKQDKIKTRNPKHDTKAKHLTHNTEVVDKLAKEASSSSSSSSLAEKEAKQPRLEADKQTEKKSFLPRGKLHKLKRPSYYIPVAIVLILLFLAFFGRSVAILCTSIGWYLIPTLSSKKTIKKKEYVRKLSDVKVANSGMPTKKKELMRRFSEINMGTNAELDGLPEKAGHRKSF